MAASVTQSKGEKYGNGGARSLSFDATPTAGHGIIVVVVGNNFPTVPTFTVNDNQGNGDYTEGASIADAVSHYTRVSIFYIPNVASTGTFTVTVTPSVNAAITMCIIEADIATSTPLLHANSGSGNSTTPATGSVNSESGALIVGGVTHNGGSERTITVGDGYTQAYESEAVSSYMPLGAEYEQSDSNDTADWTFSTSVAWLAIAASFKQPTAAGGQPTANRFGLCPEFMRAA